MKTQWTVPRDRKLGGHSIAFALMALTVLLSLVAGYFLNKTSEYSSVFNLSNLVGPTTQSLVRGDGLTACTIAMGTPGNPICFHAARMPIASLVVGLGYELFGDAVARVSVFKTLLLLIPVEWCIWLVCLRLPRSPWRRWLSVGLLLVPFGMSSFLADVVNLQVEEGYSYSLLALAFALILWKPVDRKGQWGWVHPVVFGLAVDGVYLSKSSMVLAVGLLAVSYCLQNRRWTTCVIVLGIVLAAPVGWALHQRQVSGRLSVGTSLDGINLHKGNNPRFLDRYPPAPGTDLDSFDSELNRGQHFGDEWQFNDYHSQLGVGYLKTHPKETLEGDARKLNVFLFSLRKLGSSESHGAMLKVERVGFVLFRVVQWGAILASLLYLAWGSRGDPARRLIGLSFLLLMAGVAVPYVLGFVYTRHVSVLIYPAALLCCRFLED